MAASAPKTVQITLTNKAEGPRSFFDADGSNHILRHGESWSGKILDADKEDLSADLERGDKAARDAEGGGQSIEAAAAIEAEAKLLLASNDLPKLQALAKAEKVTVPDDASADQIAIAVAQARSGKAA